MWCKNSIYTLTEKAPQNPGAFSILDQISARKNVEDITTHTSFIGLFYVLFGCPKSTDPGK